MTRKIYEKAIYTRTKQTVRKVYDRKNNVLPTNNVTLTVDVDPSDATVTLTVGGVSKVAKSITVEPGTKIDWKAEKEGYVTQEGSETLTESKTVEVTLVAETATLTVSPTPDTATVTLTAAGYTQEGNAITVAKGTEVAIKVEAENYKTSETTEIVTGNRLVEIELEPLDTEE